MGGVIIIILATILILIIAKFVFIWTSKNRIDYQEAKEIMENKDNVFIVDVRTIIEYNGSHIPRAISLPLDSIEERAKNKLRKNDYIILYCHSGSRSRKALAKLEKMGFKNLYNLGSIYRWKEPLTNE